MKKHSTFQFGQSQNTRAKRRIYAFLLAAMITTASFGQGVGINTTSPDPSAALDIQSSDKGLLIPKVSLQNSIDNTTVPNPANGLMVYNTNKDVMLGEGFYYNLGTPMTPNWKSLSDFNLPINKSTGTASGQTAFGISNFSGSGSSSAISAFSQGGYALIADGKVKISGNGQLPGSGKVLASDANGNATWEGGVAFRAQGILSDGAHILAPNTNYKVPFGAEIYDKGGNNYSLHSVQGGDTFVAPQSGIYHFDTQVTWDGGGSNVYVGLHVLSGGNIKVVCENVPGALIKPFSCSSDIELNQGDHVYVAISHGLEANLKLTNPAHFNGHIVQSIK